MWSKHSMGWVQILMNSPLVHLWKPVDSENRPLLTELIKHQTFDTALYYYQRKHQTKPNKWDAILHFLPCFNIHELSNLKSWSCFHVSTGIWDKLITSSKVIPSIQHISIFDWLHSTTGLFCDSFWQWHENQAGLPQASFLVIWEQWSLNSSNFSASYQRRQWNLWRKMWRIYFFLFMKHCKINAIICIQYYTEKTWHSSWHVSMWTVWSIRHQLNKSPSLNTCVATYNKLFSDTGDIPQHSKQAQHVFYHCIYGHQAPYFLGMLKWFFLVLNDEN